MSGPETVENDTRKLISKPPLNLLFNPTFLNRKDIWNINVTTLLEMLLEIINRTDNKDLRVCGIAALSSAMIHRIKVESIFELEKIAMQHKSPKDSRQEIQSLSLSQLKFHSGLNLLTQSLYRIC